MKYLVVCTVLICHVGFCQGAAFSDRILGKKKTEKKKFEYNNHDIISKRQFIPAIPNYEPPAQFQYAPQQNMWENVNTWHPEVNNWPPEMNNFSPEAEKNDLQKTKVPSSELNIPESEENAEAAYKGLSYYIGSTINNKVDFPPGFPVALEVDKEKSNYEEEEMKLSSQSTKSQKALGRNEIIANFTTIVDYSNSHENTGTPQSTTTPTTTTSTSTTVTTKTTNKSTKEDLPYESGNIKGTVCYLPRVVVTTRLVGYTVINEVKIYTSPRDENSVHSFVSSHEVSDAASKVTHEFVLPPEFIVEKPLSKSDMKFYNNVPVMLTSSRIEGNHVGNPICISEPCVRRTEENFGPTFNPFLPTTKTQVKLDKTTTGTTTEIPKTTTTTITTSTTPKNLSLITKIPLAIKKSLDVKVIKPVEPKKRFSIEQLNYEARHRNALFDVPGGDSSAFSGYQILGPPDVQQVWIKTAAKK
ncbi:transcription initiation factor TFIID subunit 12 [Hydra vulgaris]|uniref:Transcription initiation factor TFIID subunit 12 n=1 Tax=Hydra vulgaris TaxID=6087 RepID=A0ABM4BC54_HYDVU